MAILHFDIVVTNRVLLLISLLISHSTHSKMRKVFVTEIQTKPPDVLRRGWADTKGVLQGNVLGGLGHNQHYWLSLL